MSQKQYLKMLEKEIQNINKKIDMKIVRGEEYWKEARDHKLLLKRMRSFQRKSLFKNITQRFFPTFASF
jgi:hypothetical protein